MAAIRNYKTVELRKGCVFNISAGFLESLCRLFVPYVGNALIIKNRCDIFLEAILSNWTAQTIAGLEKEIK
jgi:hypothetical protein